MNYYEHKVDWTDAKVDRFWNFKSNYKPLQEEWFTQQVGDSIISFAKKYFSSKDNLEVLDYGAGKGHLTSLLLLENISVSACDFSNENIINLNSKFSSYSNFNDGILIRKFPTLFESNLFDFVFLIEAIEHLTDDYLESTIKEIMRILKPNGKIMITTPNNENLELGNVCCPDCGAIFHKMQHVQSFNKDVLIGLMQNIGFRTIFCKNINFADYKQFSLKRELGRLARFLKNSQKRKPHLVFVGEKK